MEFIGNHFIYNGDDSARYNMIFALSNTEEFLSIGNSPVSKTIFNRQSNRTSIVSCDYSESNISFEILAINENGLPYSLSDQRKIERWLFVNNDYRKLYINNFDDPDSYELTPSGLLGLYLNCKFINPSKITSGNGVVGYQFTVECDSSMAWQDPITKTITKQEIVNAGDNGVLIDVDTDFSGYTYPKIEITNASAGSIYICNITDDNERITAFSPKDDDDQGVPQGILIINSNTNYISGENYLRFSEQNFPRLLSGKNYLLFTGNISQVTITWSNRRFL